MANNKKITKRQAQKKLAILWFIAAGGLTLLFIVLTVTGRFDDKAARAWEWLSQNILPSLTLIMATFSANITDPSPSVMIDRFYYRLAYSISFFYLMALLFMILLAPFALSYGHLSIIDLLEQFRVYLVLAQAIVSYAIGLFFLSKT